MAKLTRVTGKVFGATADSSGSNPEIGQFGSAKAGTYNGTGDVATIQGLPAWSNGWIDAVTPTQQYPALPEMTGVHKVLSHQSSYILQEGIPEYDANTTYFINSICKGVDDDNNLILYKSLIDNNTGNALTDTTKWEELQFGLNGKADVDLINVNNAGTSLGASWAMPSTTYEDLTAGASGTQYQAPANGWFLINTTSTYWNNYTSLSNGILSVYTSGYDNAYMGPRDNTIYLPVKKNDIVTISYETVSVNKFRFVYAQGSESEA